MSDRSFGFLQGYPVKFHLIDTDAGPSLDRDDKNFPIINPTNIGIYRRMGTDNIVKAMQDLTQIKFKDSIVGNKYAEADLVGPIEAYHNSIFSPISTNIAKTLLKNSRGGVTLTEALQKIYEAIVPEGLDRHFPIAPAPSLFNVEANTPPPLKTPENAGPLFQTFITSPPIVPPTIQFAEEYDGFSAAYGFEYDSQKPPDIPDSNYENKYPSKRQTGGSGSQKLAPESIVGECFDTFIRVVDGKVSLLHSGISKSTGNPLTVSDVVIVTV